MILPEARIQSIESQIEQEQRSVKFDIREFTIEYYVDKYIKNEDKEDNEIFVPEYQREFIWDEPRQSRFIESLMLGLPVPLIFVAENPDGRLEIVDGSQRIRTLSAYLQDNLTLSQLKKLDQLNGLKFSQLSTSRQRKFRNIAMRMIVLNAQTTPEIRNEMFDRINTSGVSLMPMEVRRGIYKGPFTDFVTQLASSDKFRRMCPESGYVANRREEEEMVLRFCAFSETFPNFEFDGASLRRDGVAEYLNKYIDKKNKEDNSADRDQKKCEFEMVIDFIDRIFPDQGFAKSKNGIGVSKPYFEAIAIGSLFALRENPNLTPKSLEWAVVDKHHINDFFKILSSRYHTHTPQKLKERINYAKEQYLK